MSTPTVPVAAGTPADEVVVAGKIGWRMPIIYSLLALVALLGLARGTEGGVDTNFRLASGESFLTIPDFSVPSQVTAWVLTALLVAAAALTFVRTRNRQRLPVWLHVVVAVAFVLTFLVWAGAGKTSVISLTTMAASALALSVPLVFGSMAGVVCERSGIINIAIEGQLLFGAFAAAVLASLLANAYVGLLAAPVAGAAVGAMLAWFSVKYHVNQIIVGVVLNTLVIGLTSFLFSTLLSDEPATWNARQPMGRINIPVLDQIPVIGPILFRQSLLVYLMFAVLVTLQIMLFRSRWGLRTRAVGEHPKAADTVGIKVNRRRVLNTILGGSIAGLGGAFFTVGQGLAFGREMTDGTGYIALAAMILGKWNPRGAFVAALMFGFATTLGNTLGAIGSPIPAEFLLMIPYLVTIFAVAGFVGRVRAPAAEGIPYTK